MASRAHGIGLTGQGGPEAPSSLGNLSGSNMSAHYKLFIIDYSL